MSDSSKSSRRAPYFDSSHEARPAQAAARPQLTTRDFLDILLRGRYTIILVTVAVFALVAAITFAIPAQYRTHALVLIESDQGLSFGDLLPSIGGGGMRASGGAVQNELHILRQSLRIGETTADRLMAMRTVPGTDEELTILEPERGRPATRRVVIDRLQEDYLRIRPADRESDVIRIEAISTIPEEAELIVNLYAQAYLDRSQETSRATVAASRAFLETQVDSLAGELTVREEAVRQYMNREGAVRLDEEAAFIVEQVARLQAMQDEARIESNMRGATVRALDEEVARIEPRLAQRLASGAEGQVAAVQERLGEVQGRLETIYLRNPELRGAETLPPNVAALEREVEVLRDRAQRLSAQVLEESIAAGGVDVARGGVERVTELRTQAVDQRIQQSGLDSRAGVLGGRIAEYERDLARIPTQTIELARLLRDQQVTERLVLALSEKLQEARVAEQSELGYADLFRPALTPLRPFFPRKGLFLVGGFLFGLALGMGIAFMRVSMDHRIYRPEDLQKLGLPILGIIPDMEQLIREDFGGAETFDVGGRQLDTHLVTLLEPFSHPSEAYRGIRTNVQFSRPDVVVQTILVTSSQPGEGKSVTSSNLAVVMAQAGRRVVLVDADLRRPTVHRKFGISRRPGVVEMLFDEASGSIGNGAAHMPVEPIPSGIDNLDVLPAGAAAPNPSELLGSRAMREKLADLKSRYDIIILDAPPVLAATDAVLLSTQADAVVLVASAGKANDFEVEHSVHALQSVGAHVIGVLLNRFDLDKAFGYKYRYSYAYESKYSYGHASTQHEKERA